MKRTLQVRQLLVGLVALAVAGPGVSIVGGAEHQNVLVIIADDLGVDVLEIYEGAMGDPCTAEIDALAANGVLFTQAWSAPICSPTRATIQTGRYGLRTGITSFVTRFGNNGLPSSEIIIPEALDNGADVYTHAAIGKWHLTDETQGDDPPGDGYDGPNVAGYDHFAGLVFGQSDFTSYCEWNKTVNGDTNATTVYATKQNVNDAKTWITAQNTNGDPWFMWLAFNAPHTPFHQPRGSMICGPATEDCMPDPKSPCGPMTDPTCLELYRDMVEAMDTNMGRLFDHLTTLGIYDDTNIIFLGDNGTRGDVYAYDHNHAKGTLYEGGIHVPLIISGPRVDSTLLNTESDVLVNTTDLFATALDMMEESVPSGVVLDSVNLVPLLEAGLFTPRDFVYSEVLKLDDPQVNHGRTIRNVLGYKLIRFKCSPTGPHEELYKLLLTTDDGDEAVNLLDSPLSAEAQTNYDSLTTELDSLIDSAACDGDVNGDGVVNPLDSGKVLTKIGCDVLVCDAWCQESDVDGNGIVDEVDVDLVETLFGPCP